MKISELIEVIKNYHKGDVDGVTIDDETTRDQILYGDPNVDCTGIITTCWATIEVIKEAIKKNANFIICHEALFWNHGDKQDWLIENKNQVYFEKRKLLDEYGIVVWRDHDYIHSGIPMEDGSYRDGIFYGVAKLLNWHNCFSERDTFESINFEIPEISAKELVSKIIEIFHLNGVKFIGNPNARINKVKLPMHIIGGANDLINEAEKEDINCFLTMELSDFTFTEYVRDAAMLELDRCIIAMGHFNIEEPGMWYMAQWLQDIIPEEIDIEFVQSGDNYQYFS